MEQKINEIDERMGRLASHVLTEEHYGRAISETEYEYDKRLLEIYKQEIEQAKKIISTDSNFQNLSYQEKIVYVAELLTRLRIKNHGNEEAMVEISNEHEDNYVELNDFLDSVPQEPYKPIFEENKKR